MIKLTPIGPEETDKNAILADMIATCYCRIPHRMLWATVGLISIRVMSAIQRAIEKDDIQAAIDDIIDRWIDHDKWVLNTFPKSTEAKEIKKGIFPGMRFYHFRTPKE